MEAKINVSGTFTVAYDLNEWSVMLGRGGSIQYYIRFNPTKKISFFDVGEPRDVPDWDEVYMNVHPLGERPASGRGEEKDVVAVGHVYADLDVKDGWTQARVDMLYPPPSAKMSSGRGWYAFWFFPESIKVTDENRSSLKRLQERWVKFIGADNGAKDLARVLRVPYSYNNKEDEPLPVYIQDWNKNLFYTTEKLESVMNGQKSTGVKAKNGFELPAHIPEGGNGTGKGRDRWMFEYASHDFGIGMKYAEVLEDTLEKNERHCDPPLSEKIIEEKVQSAYKKHTQNHPEDEDIDQVDEERTFFDVHNAEEALLPRPPMKFIVDGFIEDHSLTVVAGKPGAYKTSTMMNLGVSVANGLPWLGLKTTQTNVLYVDVEMGSYSLMNRVEQVLNGLEVKQTPFQFTSAVGTLVLWKDDDRSRRILAHEIRRLGVGLCVIDPLSGILSGGDENDTSAVGTLFTNIRWVMEETGCTIVIIHHFRKDGEMYRGSSEVEAKPDNLYYFKASESSVRVESQKTRNHAPIVLNFRVNFNEMNKRFSIEAEERKYGNGMNDAKEEILSIFETHGALSITQMQSFLVRTAPSTARKILYQELVADGYLIRTNLGQSGKAIYDIKQEAPRTPRRSGSDSSGDDL